MSTTGAVDELIVPDCYVPRTLQTVAFPTGAACIASQGVEQLSGFEQNELSVLLAAHADACVAESLASTVRAHDRAHIERDHSKPA
ncbi:MAG TPA: hypothetical protein VF331_20030 [Polyangiales bacterium]